MIRTNEPIAALDLPATEVVMRSLREIYQLDRPSDIATCRG